MRSEVFQPLHIRGRGDEKMRVMVEAVSRLQGRASPGKAAGAAKAKPTDVKCFGSRNVR